MDAVDKDLLCERARDVLQNRVRPREEVTAVRRHLAHDLAQSLGVEKLSSPLSLVDHLDSVTITPSDALQGTYREYVEAVRRNVEIRAEFARLQAEHEEATAAALSSPQSESDQQAQLLELQLEVNALEQEHERLGVVDKYLQALQRQPAAAPDFLDAKAMSKECSSSSSPLPQLPKEFMDGFTQDRDAPSREIQELLSRLQKAVLRNKLLAQREKQNFEKLKARSPVDPGTLSPEAQLHALNAVKDSLISWIETMLSKAGGEDEEPSSESPVKPRQTAGGQPEEKFDRDTHIASIQREYAQHISLRQEILSSIAQLNHLKLESPPKQDPGPEELPPSIIPASEAFLLTPYLEKLQAISREQKGLIQEKSHINASLAKQQQDFNKMLSHLVEESHLLQQHPSSKKPPTNTNTTTSFGEATKGAASKSSSSVTAQVEPWIAAAHSAQIATLEAVFEKVEDGQVAADDAMQALDQVRRLLNKEVEAPEEDGQGQGQDASEQQRDMWLGEDEGGNARARVVRKNREKKKVEKQKGESIYAKLDGNLGLINE
ncbi:uncharacterized protein GGS25DRAFT_472434 [Hypoxylon fragiforme]|uniref:uncharacterized protein n=1 Tax=Hypoxylon fragiforme TaxID=63214 RepID=UPI0020C5FEC9|nr:uncharacterized protein GGS25DRAFT_472434 [Hypoxylon fragiforme]KAI2614610.1 hypothetical protein GGS25DRAFT_472434 [Hypoxylon fragiforme]